MKKLKMKASKSITFEEGCNKYLEYCRQRNLREGTINHYRQSYVQFFKFFDPNTPIEEIDEEAEVTREKACVMLVKAMGFEEVAKLENIFIAPFNDVSTNKGYIAILNENNIVSGDGSGNFNPGKCLTRADAVVLLYNYLTR